jgi:hypothetical protein
VPEWTNEMTNSKATMLKAVERMEKIVNTYYGQNLQRELAQLRSALENDDDVEISEAISETIDGCGTAVSELRSLNFLLDDFEQAQHEIQSELDAAIEAFENDQ